VTQILNIATRRCLVVHDNSVGYFTRELEHSLAHSADIDRHWTNDSLIVALGVELD
jgi:hypothetical protein